ncbi:MAG: tetratricopeptide repeat protein [Armatimonadetes bacterium]|nr:tetratricopeptide repeat protein [Anaerolineae bacterium]
MSALCKRLPGNPRKMLRLLLYTLRTQYPQWERRSQIGFALALLLVVTALVLVLTASGDNRAPALGVLGAALLSLQLITLWANRHMVTVYTRAQRLYLTGDLAGAAVVLESAQASGKADLHALTLLGNTYRQLGRLTDSEQALQAALAIDRNHHFPLTGFGRTLVGMGRYAEATMALQSALAAGAPPSVQAILGEALYYSGRIDDARTILQSALAAGIEDDVPAEWMVRYLLQRLGVGEAPTPTEAVLVYWRAAAARFDSTPYGKHLGQIVLILEQTMGDNAA